MKLKTNRSQYSPTIISLKLSISILEKILFIAIFILGITSVNAQKENKEIDNYKAFNAGLHVKNMHLWHGFVVHSGAMIATNLDYFSRDHKLNIGVWGGASFSGTDVTNKTTGESVSSYYKEFTLYSSYHFSDRFYIEAISHNNYTGVEERGDVLHYWSYNKTQGYNFVDVSFGYKITPNTLFYLATIIGGGSGDHTVRADGSFKNSWTNYFEAKSKVWEREDSNLSLFVGGAWSFFTDKTFYTTSAGNIINVGATFNKIVSLGSYKLPVDVTVMWNPEKEKTVLQVDLTIF